MSVVCLLKAEGGGRGRKEGGGEKEQNVDVLIRKRVRPRLLFEKVEYMVTRIRVETPVKSSI